MFNMGGGELMLVALVALLLIPPKKLPDVATKLGQWVRKFQQGFQEVKSSIEISLKDDVGITHDQKKSLNKPRDEENKTSKKDLS